MRWKAVQLYRIFRAGRTLQLNEKMSRESLKGLQQKALKKLRDYAFSHSPFYREFHRNHENSPLEELPVLTKGMLMERFDDLVTDRSIRLSEIREYIDRSPGNERYRGKYEIAATSGTTGKPGLFVFNDGEWNMAVASLRRAQVWSNEPWNVLRHPNVVNVGSMSPWHLSSRYIETLRSRFIPVYGIPCGLPLPELVDRLNRIQPYFLSLYPSIGRTLAAEQLSGRLTIKPVAVYGGGELLTKETRRKMEMAWGREPYDFYGATETAGIAAEYHSCRRMHLFEDLVIIENLDERNRPVPDGEYGSKLVITNLFNLTQPLIRYEISDSVKISSEPCPHCNLPFKYIESIQGRQEEVLILAGTSGRSVTIQPGVFDRIMDLLPVSGWQVVQQSNDSIRILLAGIPATLDWERLGSSIEKDLRSEGAGVHVTVQIVDEIPKSGSGKTSLIRALNRTSETA